MKRLGLLFSFILLTLTAQGQVQSGIVKTNGRPNKPGRALSGVAVKTTGRNASLSDNNGFFSLNMNGMKGGDSFFLTSVTRIGYEIADRNAVGRRYGFSPSVPLTLTMVSKAELEEEKQRIRNNAIVATQKKYEQKLVELENLLEKKTISEETFGRQLQDLQKKMDQYNDLIENLADKYARTDYDVIDPIDRAINEAIEIGLFEKADSLIKSKGDIEERHQKVIAWTEASKKQKEAIDKQMAQWETSEEARVKELENLAEDYYHSFAIEVSRMNPEKAVEWLEKRSDLDPERLEWLIEVGKYYKDYLAQYDRAIVCFERVYAIAKQIKSTKGLMLVLNELGGTYIDLHNLDKAEKCYGEALKCTKKDQKEYTTFIASLYNNLGLLCSNRRDFDQALSYYEKALVLMADSVPETAMKTYNNKSAIYTYRNQFGQAEECLDKAIALAEQYKDKRTLTICYNNKGTLRDSQGKEKEALPYYEKALALEREIYPENHPSIANTLSNISSTYQNLECPKEALDYTIQSLKMYQKIYGESHPHIAQGYEDVATFLLEAGHYDKALSYAKKSWQVFRIFYPQTSKEYAKHCNTLGRIYNGLKQDSLAMDYYQQGLSTYETLGLTTTTLYATICNNISTLLCDQKRYDEAMTYMQKRTEITLKIKGKDNSNYITALNNLGYIYNKSGQKDSALAVYHEAEEIILRNFGKWNLSLATNYNNVGSVYLDIKEYDKARTYFFKSLEIRDSVYNEPCEAYTYILSNIAMSYYRDGKWRETLPWIERAAIMRSHIVKDEDRRYSYYVYLYDCYAQLAKSGNKEDIQNYKTCQDSLWFSATISPDGVAAKKYGLSGKYMLLRYGGWEQGGVVNFTEESIRQKEISRTEMVIYRDDVIKKIVFEENTLGIKFFLNFMQPEESEHIKAVYDKWKNTQSDNTEEVI